MDIFFQDPNVIPLPPEEVRIKVLRADPWPDNRRIHIYLELTPFQKRPNGEILINDPNGEEVASASIIETMVSKMELTMHLHGPIPTGQYQATAIIFYEEMPDSEQADEPVDPPKRKVVDSAKSDFKIQAKTESQT